MKEVKPNKTMTKEYKGLIEDVILTGQCDTTPLEYLRTIRGDMDIIADMRYVGASMGISNIDDIISSVGLDAKNDWRYGMEVLDI